jgi:hypothetical protein
MEKKVWPIFLNIVYDWCVSQCGPMKRPASWLSNVPIFMQIDAWKVCLLGWDDKRMTMICSRDYKKNRFEASRLWDPKIDSSPFPNTDQRDRFELLYPCSRHQHSPRSFHTCTTTVETHREISWSLNSHYTTTWTRHPNWHPTTRWHLNSRHVDWVPTFYGGITVDISMGWCNMAMALQIFRFQIALSEPLS